MSYRSLSFKIAATASDSDDKSILPCCFHLGRKFNQSKKFQYTCSRSRDLNNGNVSNVEWSVGVE